MTRLNLAIRDVEQLENTSLTSVLYAVDVAAPVAGFIADETGHACCTGVCVDTFSTSAMLTGMIRDGPACCVDTNFTG